MLHRSVALAAFASLAIAACADADSAGPTRDADAHEAGGGGGQAGADAAAPDAPSDGPSSDAPVDADTDADADAALPEGTPCVPSSVVDGLTHTFSCDALHTIEAPLAALPFDCHTQGIGRFVAGGQFLITCMDLGGQSGRVLSFPVSPNDNGRWLAESSLEVHVDAQTTHPSATQVGASGVFPVAMAKASDSGPSVVRFYEVAADGALAGPLGEFFQQETHIGALAYASVGGRTLLLGCGWNCATFTSWTADGTDATSGFSRIVQANTQDLVASNGIDTNVGSYNSLYLAPRCEDGALVLFASHDDWLDVWEVTEVETTNLSLRKIAKRQISESVVLWGLNPVFREGMTLDVQQQSAAFWAAPHDFGTSSCPSGTRCAQYVYRCHFQP